MPSHDLTHLLERVRSGEVPVADAVRALADRGATLAPSEVGAGSRSAERVVDLGYARVDLDRKARLGLPEVVFGEPKTVEQIVGVVRTLAERGQNALVTRVDGERAVGVERALLALGLPPAHYHQNARCLSVQSEAPRRRLGGSVAVVTAGTGDVPVAEEAAVTLELAGERVERFYDVGVAGLHRLLGVLPELERASAIICVAGMEGALPSVLGGLVRVPVYAVPSSVGYGVSAGGFAALVGMLSSCSAGVCVLNIDNGFGAAMAVLRHAQAVELERAGER